MNRNWYKSRLVKILLVLMAHVMTIVMAAGFLWIFSGPGFLEEALAGTIAKKYEDSAGFVSLVNDYSFQAVKGLGQKSFFETDGKLDEDRVIDLQEYYDGQTISGQNTSGLAFRMGDLIDWSEEYKNGYTDEPAERIVVCQKPDGTYHYYTISQLVALIEGGELSFVQAAGDSHEAEELLMMLENSDYMEETAYLGLQNAQQIVYTDCWGYDGYLCNERYQPVGAESILEVANENPAWNGRLSEAYRMIDDIVCNLGDRYSAYMKTNTGIEEGNTNFSYIYADMKAGKVYTNKTEFGEYKELEQNLETVRSSGKYVIVRPKLEDFESNLAEEDALWWRDGIREIGISEEDFLFAACVDTAFPIQDHFYQEKQVYEKYARNVPKILVLCVGALSVFVICVIWLCMIAGRRAGDERLHLCWLDRWKTEIAAVFVIFLWIFPVLFTGSTIADSHFYMSQSVASSSAPNYVSNVTPYIIVCCIFAAYTCMMFLTGLLCLARKIKAHSLWKNSVLRDLCGLIREMYRNLGVIWKTVLVYSMFMLLHWMTLFSGGYVNEFLAFLMFVAETAGFVYLIYQAVGRKKVTTGIAKIAGGEVDYKISLKGLRAEQRAMAEAVNNIGEGLTAAVEESMKSERLKTDLITNVSHDIKTPLTSIINYIDLLKRENFQDPKIQGYLDVLEAKAQRLKTLTEDVVEASKVSSGNITLEYMNINLIEMIQQTSGEFTEKFAERSLQEVLNLPEGEVIIRVDGRRMWRILENVYNNAAKYAMEGTRVYADLIRTDTEAIFSLKNISEQPLNIRADELTERFIRGDISRSSEGSGLGLSIAKTLTEMQGGRFELYLDGDLFRVTITFQLGTGYF